MIGVRLEVGYQLGQRQEEKLGGKARRPRVVTALIRALECPFTTNQEFLGSVSCYLSVQKFWMVGEQHNSLISNPYPHK